MSEMTLGALIGAGTLNRANTVIGTIITSIRTGARKQEGILFKLLICFRSLRGVQDR